MGIMCSWQKVKYELVADVYVLVVELSMAILRRIECSWIKWSIAQGS
jgi:hypothetical protein